MPAPSPIPRPSARMSRVAFPRGRSRLKYFAAHIPMYRLLAGRNFSGFKTKVSLISLYRQWEEAGSRQVKATYPLHGVADAAQRVELELRTRATVGACLCQHSLA